MYAGRGKSYYNVSLFNVFLVDNGITVNDTAGISGKVVFIFGIESGHFGSFSAYKSTSAHNASVSYAGDYGSDFFGNIFAACNVVEEYERSCTAADYIVHAHCYAVNTDSIVLVH